MLLQEKIETFERFWAGEGPCLILIPPPVGDTPPQQDYMGIYDTTSYPEKFNNPELMWESEIRKARAVVDAPTDGIPTVRPNLGVIFVPALAGLGYDLKEDQMPWPGSPLPRESIRENAQRDLSSTAIMQLAAEFYGIHRDRGGDEIAAYQADTQGVFDVAHLLYGDEVFYELPDDAQQAWVRELMDISLGLCVRATRELKALLAESDNGMIHGHGTAQGVYFPHAGVRVCEDTATLLSPQTLDEWILPYIQREMAPFSGGFLHFCGKHEALFERLCRCPEVRAIDLGNPEMYDPQWLLETCAKTKTVLFSRLASENGEDWRSYLHRMADLVRQTRARCILRPALSPKARDDCADMQDMWHQLTAL